MPAPARRRPDLPMTQHLRQDRFDPTHQRMPAQGGQSRPHGLQLPREAGLMDAPHVAAVVPALACELEEVVGSHGPHFQRRAGEFLGTRVPQVSQGIRP